MKTARAKTKLADVKMPKSRSTSAKSSRARQTTMIKREKSAYGGDLLKTRAGRRGARPLSTRETMHLVLRSTKARGAFSFLNGVHKRSIDLILKKFAFRYGVKILSYANAGNHLHIQLKLSSRHTYRPFIRAVTGAIAMAVSGRSRWAKSVSDGRSRDRDRDAKTLATRGLKEASLSTAVCGASADARASGALRFWDQRPFTRIVSSFAAFKNLKNYVRLNQIEAEGYSRKDARAMVEAERVLWGDG